MTTQMTTTMTGMPVSTTKKKNVGSFIPNKDAVETSQQKISDTAVCK